MVCRYVEIRCQVNVSGIMVWISHKNQARANNVERNPKCTHMNHKFIAIIVIMHHQASAAHQPAYIIGPGRLGILVRSSVPPPKIISIRLIDQHQSLERFQLINQSHQSLERSVDRIDQSIDQSALFSSWAAPVSSRCPTSSCVFMLSHNICAAALSKSQRS